MNAAVQSFNGYPSGCSEILMNFDLEYADRKPVFDAAPDMTQLRGRRHGHIKIAGIHIDDAFGKVDVLWKLDKRTLERMATDESTPVVVLERLATHPDADVRAAVSDNENTPLYTVWTLSKDSDADVRYQLAENHNLPLTLIRSLANDENPYVACRAQQTLERLSSQ